MSGKGTIDHNWEQVAWVEINEEKCYVVKKVFTIDKKDHISYPERYYLKASQSYRCPPVFITILQEYKKGEFKGDIIYPDVYELRYFVLINKKEQSIQGGRTTGKAVPISELYVVKKRTSEQAKEENKKELIAALIRKKF